MVEIRLAIMGLAGARGADHDKIMSTRSGNFNRPLDMLLPLDINKINGILGMLVKGFPNIVMEGRDGALPV